MSRKIIVPTGVTFVYRLQPGSDLRIRGRMNIEEDRILFVDNLFVLDVVPYDYRNISMSFGDKGTLFTIVYPEGEPIRNQDLEIISDEKRLPEGPITFTWRTNCGNKEKDVTVILVMVLNPSKGEITLSYYVN